MIRPIFSEPETLLDRCVFSQNQHTFIPAQLRIRRDVHIELSVFFQRKNVDVILFSDIEAPFVLSVVLYLIISQHPFNENILLEMLMKNFCEFVKAQGLLSP